MSEAALYKLTFEHLLKPDIKAREMFKLIDSAAALTKLLLKLLALIMNRRESLIRGSTGGCCFVFLFRLPWLIR